MDWLIDLFAKPSVGQQVLALSLTAAIGIMLGKVKVKGVSLGGAVCRNLASFSLSIQSVCK